jgi:hypothetical protein
MSANIQEEVPLGTELTKSRRPGAVETNRSHGKASIADFVARGATPRDAVGDWLFNLAQASIVPVELPVCRYPRMRGRIVG